MILGSDNLILAGFIIASLFLIKGPNFQYYWFVFNGIWIHLYLDGTVGYWQKHQWLFQKYSELDLRYPLQEPTLMTISAIEFFIMGPLCVWIALRIKFQKNEILTNFLIGLTSAIQIMGTIFFVANEWSRNFKDVCQYGCFTYTFANIFYFWIFFVAANPVWIIVPLQQIITAYKNLKNLFEPKKSKKA
ncbi:unnamed protein product [Paramecium pentaurelia]|uniref:EXPERA domain-containing protein n=1 Tax=Paramecium pentaurelia TaxID=43138 RepID=A0A8S1SCV6_9CILI|nr:unnamed protein product [Paramecium pentaurelia]